MVRNEFYGQGTTKLLKTGLALLVGEEPKEINDVFEVVKDEGTK